MQTISALIKFLLFILFITVYLFFAFLISRIYLKKPAKKFFYLTKIVSLFCKLGSLIFNLKIIIKNPKNVDISNRSLWVGNHLSYLDIIALSQFKNTIFVTSKEMQKTAGLGLLCEMAGCYFVDRKNRHNLRKEIHDLSKVLEIGPTLTFFPEAQATNGDQVIKFRSPLFESAILANSKIVPFCINYISVNNLPITIHNRDQIFWYGDMTFFDHFWNFLKTKKVVVEITILGEISPQDLTRDEISQKCYQLISSHYKPISF